MPIFDSERESEREGEERRAGELGAPGARNKKRGESECQSSDLCCWLSIYSLLSIPQEEIGGRGLAGIRRFAVRYAARRRKRIRVKMVYWWRKIVFPVKRAIVSVAARVKTRKNDDGLTKLHNDVQTCGYEDVQVMWEILKRSEMVELETLSQRRRRFWRVFVFSSSSDHHN